MEDMLSLIKEIEYRLQSAAYEASHNHYIELQKYYNQQLDRLHDGHLNKLLRYLFAFSKPICFNTEGHSCPYDSNDHPTMEPYKYGRCSSGDKPQMKVKKPGVTNFVIFDWNDFLIFKKLLAANSEFNFVNLDLIEEQ